VCEPCSPGHKADPLLKQHADMDENPDEITNEPVTSKGRKKRSISDMIHDFFMSD